MASTSILLKGGKVLLHGAKDEVTASVQDILVEGNKIAKIAPSIDAQSSNQVIDCTDKLISPGFIDTHRHLWQTQLKGRHANETLFQYMPTGNMACSFYDGDSTYLGVLGGCLESIDAGTTTIVDHAHNALSPEIMLGGALAFEDSGVRGTYCTGLPTTAVRSFSPKVELSPEPIPNWWQETYEKVAKQLEAGSGRVRLGLSYDLFFLGEASTKSMFEHAREHGAKIITSHSVHSFACVPQMKNWGLLGSDILVSHFNNRTDEMVTDLKISGGHVSSTPSSELQMTLGYPVCFEDSVADVSSLGVDCHSLASASIISEARLGLQVARSIYNDSFQQKGQIAPALTLKIADAFNLATIKGARACGQENEIGSIAEGKFADLVIFDTTTPSMVAAAEHEPLAAILLHSSIRDVDTVIVDGIIRKQDGKLLPTMVKGDKTEWNQIAKETIKSREAMQREIDKVDYAQVNKDLAAIFGW